VPKSVFAFKEGSDRFAIVGPGMNRNAAIVGLGIGINLTNTAQLHFNYDGELGSQGQNHTGRIILEVKF
jgi:uncharacterized protein with beta-barrel porin domain